MVDAGNLAGDPLNDALDQVVGQLGDGDVRRVGRVDRAQRAGIAADRAAVPAAERLDVGQDDEIVRQLAVQPGFDNLRAEDGVRIAQQRQLLLRDFADAAHREAGPGEGLAVEQILWNAERVADGAHLVLEQHPNRLDAL